MRNASKLAKGGVVLGLSMATFIAYGGTAFAATTPAGSGAITITPPAGGTTGNTSPGADSCLVYTATQTGATGGYLDVSVNSTSGNAAFCAPTGTPETPAGTPPPTRTERVSVNGSGQATFGVTDTSAESVSIQVWDDNVTADDKFTGGEPNALASATFVNAQGNSAVKSLSASHTTTPAARPGDRVRYIVSALNGNSAVPVADQGVSGAQINYVVTGPDAQGPFACQQTLTNNSGTAFCAVDLSNNSAAGTDTVTFFVNNAPNSQPGVDAGDTQTTATITNIGKSPAGDTLVGFCDFDNNNGPATSNNSGRTCSQAIDTTNPNLNNQVNEDFAFDVLDPATNPLFVGGSTNHTSDDGADVPVTFTMSGASSAASLTNTTDDCTTNDFLENGQGGCSTFTEVEEPNPTPGEVITVTATITGTTISSTSSITLSAAVSTARNITLSPPSQNVVVGHTGVLTATVTDSKGDPVPGVNVDFTSTGEGAFTSGCVLSSTCVSESSTSNFLGLGLPQTNAKGQVQVQVSSNTTGNEAVSAAIDPNQQDQFGNNTGTQCGDAAGFVNGLPVSGVTAGNCTSTAAVNYVNAPVVHQVSERPHLSGHKSGHSVHLRAVTHPNLRHRTVHFYIVRNGIKHLVASHGTGSTGVAHATIRHLKKGHYTFVCRVVKLGSHYVSHFSNRIHKHIH